MPVIARTTSRRKGRLAAGGSAAACLAGLTLAACTSSLDLFDRSARVDRSIATGTVASTQQPANNGVSDETTVRNAVSSADLGKLAGQPLPWANAATGSAGVISAIRQSDENGLVCRDFTTTRHSYEGIAIFTGRACLAGKGGWTLIAFDRQ